MPFQPGANINTVAFGNRPENVEVPHLDVRAPSTQDYNYPIGKRWVYIGVSEYVLLSISTAGGVAAANWSLNGTDTGPLNTLSDDSSVTVAPVAGNIQIAGTSAEIATTAGTGVITLSIPAVFTAPGSIASTTTLTSGTSLAVTTSATVGTTLAVTGTTTLAAVNATNGTFSGTLGVTGTSTLHALTQTGTASINASGAGVTTIGTGGTGATNIGNATGNTAVTGSLSTTTSLSATTTVTGGTGVTATTGDVTSTAGSLVSTVGSLKLNGVASRVLINASAPTTAPVGLVTLSGATTTTLTSSAITANSIILFSLKTLGTLTASAISYTVTGGSATITSFGPTDTSTYGYLIIN